MSLHGFNKPLLLQRSDSHYALVYLLIAHACALLAIIVLQIAWYWQICALLAWCAHLGYALHHYQHQAHLASGHTWIWFKHDIWHEQAHQRRSWEMVKIEYLCAWLVIVRLQRKGRQCRWVCWCDQLDATTFRRLRVRLRLWRASVEPVY